MDRKYGSKDIAKAAVEMSMTKTREDEKILRAKYKLDEILTAGADYGGEYISSVTKIIERTIVCAKREGVIGESHLEEGAVAGATHEALTQISQKAIGLNIGGKIGVARYGDHISVCIFVAIGLLHLNDIAIGLGHRAV